MAKKKAQVARKKSSSKKKTVKKSPKSFMEKVKDGDLNRELHAKERAKEAEEEKKNSAHTLYPRPRSYKPTPRQELWLDEYFKDYNAKQAAYRAGYSDPGRSGHENYIKLKYHIEHKRAEVVKNVKITREEILANMEELAFAPGTRDSVRVKALEALAKYQGLDNEFGKGSGREDFEANTKRVREALEKAK